MARPVLLVALIALLAAPGGVSGQDAPPSEPVTLSVEPATGALSVKLGDLLDDGGLRRALHSGLPLRIRFQVELWKDRFFDSQKGAAEWRATVVYEPLGRSYQVETSSGGGRTTHATLEAAGRALGRRFDLPLRPDEAGRFYYLGVLEVETLSLSDLEELQRWLRGDLAPAVSGDDGVENAVEKGVRRLVVRILGLPARRLRIRTPTFSLSGG